MSATVLLQNTPSGTDGTAITQANRLTTTNTPDAFDNIVFGSGGSASIATNGSKKVHRLVSTSGNSTEGWSTSLGGSKADFAFKAKFVAPPAAPTGLHTFLKGYSDNVYTTAAWSVVEDTAGQIRLYAGTGSALITLAPVLSPGAEYTVRGEIIAGTSGELHLYDASGAEVDADIAASTAFGATASVRRGLGNGPVLAQFDMTEFKVGVGPGLIDAATPLTVNAGPDSTAFTTDTPTLGATVANGSGGAVTYAWTKVSGPAASFSASSSPTTSLIPSGGVGAYVLRVTATDSSGSASDTVTVTVSAAPTVVKPVTVNTAVGWTPTSGSTNQQAISDGNDASWMRSPDNPTNAEVNVTNGTLAQPAAGQDYVHSVKMRRNNGSSGTAVAKLFDGSTLYATSATKTIPTTAGWVDFVFAAADIASIPTAAWAGIEVSVFSTAS